MPQRIADLHGVLASLFETTSDRVQAVAAAGAITLPWWLPDLHEVSAEAALFAPILGCLWFVIQITLRLIEFRRKSRP